MFARGRIEVDFVGLQNFQILLFGTERTHLLGLLEAPTPSAGSCSGWERVLIVWSLVDALPAGTCAPWRSASPVAGALFAAGLLGWSSRRCSARAAAPAPWSSR